MVKNSVLTSVLAGVLGVSVVGSGVLYFLTNDIDDTENSKKETSIENVTENISNTLETAKKAVNGELDFAYDANVKISFGEGATEQFGTQLLPLSFSTSTKQKGQNASADFSVAYNEKTLCSLNTVYSREGNDVYAQIPELSDSYIKCNVDTFKSYFSEILGVSSVIDFDSLKEESVNFDTEAFKKSLEEYEQTIKDNMPEVKDGENLSGKIDDIEYEYTTKSYTVGEDDVTKVAKALLEKAKTDETLKSYYDEQLKTAYTLSEEKAVDYETMIQSLIDGLDTVSSSESETVGLNVYYNSKDEVVGFLMTNPSDEKSQIKYITVNTDTVCGIDLLFDIDNEKMSLYGSAKIEDEVTNGTFTLNSEVSSAGEKTVVDGTLTIKDVKENGDAFSGTIRGDINIQEGDADATSGWLVMTSDSSDDALDLSYEIGVDGKSFFTIEITGNKTEASDITVPTEGTIYDAMNETEMDTYLENCDTQAFTENIKSIFGAETYALLFESTTEEYEDDEEYIDYDEYFDEDYDYEEYGYEMFSF